MEAALLLLESSDVNVVDVTRRTALCSVIVRENTMLTMKLVRSPFGHKYFFLLFFIQEIYFQIKKQLIEKNL